MNDRFKSVLIAAPTSVTKKYCFIEWLDNIMNLSYPNFKVVLVDNTPDKGVYAEWMNKMFRQKYGANNSKFTAFHLESGVKNIIHRMTESCNLFRDYAIRKKYDYVFSCETDVFPPSDCIEKLLFQDKQVIGALYDRDEGEFRQLCIQTKVSEAPRRLKAMNLGKPVNEISFIDGTAKPVFSVGLGAVLIHIDVLKQIHFRYVPGVEWHPDSFFSEDCMAKNYQIFAHTGVICRHENNSRYWTEHSKQLQ